MATADIKTSDASSDASSRPKAPPPAKVQTPIESSAADLEIDSDQIDDIFKELKTLLTIVEKLQKARQDVGDIKSTLIKLLDGDLLSDDEIEQLKAGVGNLSKLVRLYSDYQLALANAQPARALLDRVIK